LQVIIFIFEKIDINAKHTLMTVFTKTILNRILLKRKSLSYSQSYVAYKLGICQEAYGKIERGQTELTTNRLSKIADVFDIDVFALII
jgi:transcriptional regulator with XRE-family HTH domain